MLKDTEKRWEVIDIDNEDDNTNESRKKKRKVSLSPQGFSNSNNVASAAAVDQELRNIYNSSTYSSNNNLSQIVVEGCGQPDINGTYTRVVEIDTSLYRDYALMYAKTGQQSNNYRDHVIHRGASSPFQWYISDWHGDAKAFSGRPGGVVLYKSKMNEDYVETPPEDGWSPTLIGELPAPKCRIRNNNEIEGIVRASQSSSNANRGSILTTATPDLQTGEAVGNATKIVEQVTVEGCGLTEVNGIYKRVDEMYKGFPVYKRNGQWKGQQMTFEIWCGITSGSRYWYIQPSKFVDDDDCLYVSSACDNRMVPSKEGWKAFEERALPVPKLTWQ